MNNLSVLIFSRNDLNLLFDLISNIYNFADEVVIIDCSDQENSKLLFKRLNIPRFRKVKIYQAPAFGYANPSTVYGISKCKYKWILQLDTDERLSPRFVNDVKSLLRNTNCDAFAIKLYDIMNKEDLELSNNRWVVRVYKKDKVTFKGAIHELPEVKGKIESLTQTYYFIKHLVYHHNIEKTQEKLKRYYIIEAFEHRLDYKDLIEFAKMRKLPIIPINIYLIFKKLFNNKNLTEELSENEYKIFFLIFYIVRRILIFLPKTSPSQYLGWYGNEKTSAYNYYMGMINCFFTFAEKERLLQFEISKEIIKYDGVIKYLSLDNENVIKMLTLEFYNGAPDGITFFVNLLKLRYKYGKTYYQRLPK